MEKDFYEILGVAEDADKAAIKKAYREKARKYHPDVNPDNPEAEEKFKKASAAFEVLSSPEKRKLYDEFGLDGLREGFDPEQARQYQRWQQAGGGGGGGGRRVYRGGATDFQDIFGDIFGGQSPFDTSDYRDFGGFQGAAKGRDITAALELDFVQAIEGDEMTLTLGGDRITVRIPPGVRDGEKLRIKGKGQPGPQTQYGQGEPGDLHLKISVRDHPRVRREGLNLYMDVPITIPEAVEGTKVDVPTPWGTLTVTIPAGVNSGAKLRIKDKGVKRGKKKGNFYVVIQINTPEEANIDEEVIQKAQALAGAYDKNPRHGLSWNA